MRFWLVLTSFSQLWTHFLWPKIRRRKIQQHQTTISITAIALIVMNGYQFSEERGTLGLYVGPGKEILGV
jgi:hypothetical protein